MSDLIKILLLLATGLIARPVLAQVNKNAPGSRPASSFFERMDQAILSKEYPNIHSVLVMHKGKLVYEKYYAAKDEALGEDLGIVTHSAETLHDLRSVTKSVVSIAIGIAIKQGKIKSEEERVMKYFPSHNDLDTGLRSKLTIKHLLMMASGMDWNENLPYTDTMNSEIAMSVSADPIRYILSRPIVEEAGKTFSYNGGNTQLLAAIIETTCGISLDQFINRFLFVPLGITDFYWYKVSDKNNLVAAASGLRLRSRDMMKIGQLLLNNGLADGKQIVDKVWVQKSLSKQINRDKDGGYGYQFWVLTAPGDNDKRPLPTAVGNGDQRIFIDRDKQLVVVVTSGNYNKWDVKKASYELLNDFIYPALAR
ncbi:MAG: class C beta-lactamase-related serine hydrolase [Chitinophagaceae bacterium]|nr:MAG: class C beta-lactamase-related serine hydrolase [Chitinophagaceae bacterium]